MVDSTEQYVNSIPFEKELVKQELHWINYFNPLYSDGFYHTDKSTKMGVAIIYFRGFIGLNFQIVINFCPCRLF